MATDIEIRQFTEQAMRRISRAVAYVESLRRDIHAQRRRPSPTFPRFIRTGVAYGGSIPAGTEDAPGEGEWLIDNIELDAPEYVDEESTPQKIFNVGPTAIAEGTRFTAGLHISSRRGSVNEPCWVTTGHPGDGGSGGTAQYAKVWSVERSPAAPPVHVYFDGFEGNDPPFEAVVNGSAQIDGIKCKQAGLYIAHFNVMAVHETSAPSDIILDVLTSGGAIPTNSNDIPVKTSNACTHITKDLGKFRLTVDGDTGGGGITDSTFKMVRSRFGTLALCGDKLGITISGSEPFLGSAVGRTIRLYHESDGSAPNIVYESNLWIVKLPYAA